jgi:DNA-binding NarL/FixJ family response regulator
MDIAMPEMNGIEAARQIHAAAPQTQIVILSMHAGAEHVFQALEAGARGYLLKESAAKEICDAVRAVHHGRRYLSARVAEVLAERVGRRTAVSGRRLFQRPHRRDAAPLAEDGRHLPQPPDGQAEPLGYREPGEVRHPARPDVARLKLLDRLD